MDLQPITLRGTHAVLLPLQPAHAAALWRAGADPAIWTWMPFAIASAADMATFVQRMLEMQTRGQALPFVIFAVGEPEPIGSSSYLAIDMQHKRVEIGATWLNARWQRTAINTECKYLLLRHAFETLGCMRVEFKTDANNVRSRAALLRIGAFEEGTFRRHMLMPGGRVRDSVYYSVLDTEWPGVKRRLEAKLQGDA